MAAVAGARHLPELWRVGVPLLPPAGDPAARRGGPLPRPGPPGGGVVSRILWAATGFAAATLVLTGSGSPPGPPPAEELVIAYACQHPSDAVLAWAEAQGVHVDVRECPPREEK